MLFVSEQGEFLKKVINTKNLCKLFTYRGLLWVPGGTRTHDIQNHNLIPAPLEIPLFMRKVNDFDFIFAPILRRISTIIALTLLFYPLICL
jgi:hypothetical protein